MDAVIVPPAMIQSNKSSRGEVATDEAVKALAREAAKDYQQLASLPEGPLQRVKDAEQITQSLLVRMDELLGVAGSLEKDAQVCRALDAAVAPQLEQLKAVYRLIDLCARYVAEVDAAVTAMENAVNESTREFNKRALKSTLGSVTRWLGASVNVDVMPPLVIPPEAKVNTDKFVASLQEAKHAKLK